MRKIAGRNQESQEALWMGIIEDVFQMEGKECEDQKRMKM